MILKTVGYYPNFLTVDRSDKEKDGYWKWLMAHKLCKWVEAFDCPGYSDFYCREDEWDLIDEDDGSYCLTYLSVGFTRADGAPRSIVGETVCDLFSRELELLSELELDFCVSMGGFNKENVAFAAAWLLEGHEPNWRWFDTQVAPGKKIWLHD